MRRTCWALAFVAGVAVSDASGQSATPPVELGVDVSTSVLPNRNGFQWGPRVVMNLDGRNAVQFTVSLQNLSPWDDFAQKKTDLYLAAYRRLVHTAGPVRVFATLGGGLDRTVIVVPETTFGNPPITFPSSRGVAVRPLFSTGTAIDLRVGRRAAIVLESSFLLTEVLGGRVSGGLVVPVGSVPSRPDRLASSVPWAALDPGERAWVTTGDGREAHGEVVGRSADALTLRTLTGVMSFSAADVHAIDTTDSIRNGTVRGAKIGTLGGAVPAVFVTGLFCSLVEECSVGDMLRLSGAFVGIGVGVGMVTGALVDSLRERRVPLYRRAGMSSLLLAPIIDRHRLGGGATLRW